MARLPTKPLKPTSNIKLKARPGRDKGTGRPIIKPGKFTVRQLLDSTRTNFRQQDWGRAKAQGRHFSGDKGLLYDTKISVGKPSRAPWGIRFQTTTYAPEEFGTDAKGRFPRKWVQYVELPFDYDRNNVRGHKEFRVFCQCPRFKFGHHYVLWQAGHAPKPQGKGLQAPDYARRGTRAVGCCKHLVLALLTINKMSAANRVPELLPDKAWLEIERYWNSVERGESGEAMLSNLKNAPDSVRKLAVKVATEGRAKRDALRRKDWSARGLRIPKPR